ncbi:hypothetical protein PROFUN_10735 [Planoprotostelium fungivorum]|uniref:Uncharacterized protein n=1 Tax=Planoprotostelium fungivorum TaxID=1890364 RepID=A0A2P6N7X2_9EUKA|nr:hypothetical protein PROFUN_10735 [Planoprotostelium fungivorum]
MRSFIYILPTVRHFWVSVVLEGVYGLGHRVSPPALRNFADEPLRSSSPAPPLLSGSTGKSTIGSPSGDLANKAPCLVAFVDLMSIARLSFNRTRSSGLLMGLFNFAAFSLTLFGAALLLAGTATPWYITSTEYSDQYGITNSCRQLYGFMTVFIDCDHTHDQKIDNYDWVKACGDDRSQGLCPFVPASIATMCLMIIAVLIAAVVSLTLLMGAIFKRGGDLTAKIYMFGGISTFVLVLISLIVYGVKFHDTTGVFIYQKDGSVTYGPLGWLISLIGGIIFPVGCFLASKSTQEKGYIPI